MWCNNIKMIFTFTRLNMPARDTTEDKRLETQDGAIDLLLNLHQIKLCNRRGEEETLTRLLSVCGVVQGRRISQCYSRRSLPAPFP
ncbi:hypothetical protein F0562_031028 [Nyssa sinensis]|uniref:Uncharacterized protein n=1 Tax=Nyssa sinensis TaxID=561372 RepID=A0A5J5AT87_9ASTE|nr:hypothetical protein F0562_031028 [Nyssa sinensis]